MTTTTRKDDFWLTLSERGASGLDFRLNRRPPSTGSGDVVVHVTMAVPALLFVRPMITAAITVTDEQAAPTQIDATVLDSIGEAVKAVTGLDVRLTVDNATPQLQPQLFVAPLPEPPDPDA